MTNKLALLLAALFLLATSVFAGGEPLNLTGEEKAWLQQHPVISMGSMNNWPPLNFTDKGGKPQGIGLAYVEALNRRLGGAIVLHPAPFKENYDKVRTGELDALMDISGRPDRKALFYFTRPYVTVPHVLVGRKEGPYFGSEAELAGKTVALERGFYNVTHFSRNFPLVIVREYDSTSHALDAVARGEADAYAGNRAVAIHLIEKELFNNLRLMGRLQGPKSVLQIGVGRDKPLLASILNKALNSISEEEQNAIQAKWTSVRYERGINYPLLLKVVSVSLLLLSLFGWWILRLAKEIRVRKQAEEELSRYREQLEDMVRERSKALAESESFLNSIFDNIPNMIFVKDAEDLRFVKFNKSGEKLLGTPCAELIGKNDYDFFPKQEADFFTSRDREVLTTRQGLDIPEETIQTMTGPRILHTRKVPILDQDGIPRYLVGISEDITDLKRAEELLKSREESYRCFAELTSDYVHKCSRTGCEPFRIQWMGGAISAISGYTMEEVFKLGCWLPLVHPDDRQMMSSHLSNPVPGEVKQLEFRIVTKQGDIRWISEKSRCEAGEGEGELVLYGAATDITERKNAEAERQKLEQQLLHAQKLESLGVLAGGIAHDFNNILTAIIGNADLALMRISKESPVVDNLHRIEHAASRAADLAKQMLAYSGKGKFIVENIDLNRLLEEMLHMLEVSISKKAVLRLGQYQHLPMVEADTTQIHQIIMNLVINASEAIGDKSGVIAITTGCMDCDRSYLKDVWLDENLTGGLYVYLEISDSGCGMDKETLSKLFDPFFTTKFTGRGLGMAAVLGIVRGHRGAIKVYSEPGRGTSFKILFPANSRPAELFNGETHPDSWKGEGKVLLVDDEETIRGIGSEMLRELGFTVVTANDGRAAVETFKSTPDIAFVILDLTMPHMDGEQCFRELRQLDHGVKVIMSSGYNEQEVTQKFAGKGLSGFIQKPYKMSKLQEIIRNIKD